MTGPAKKAAEKRPSGKGPSKPKGGRPARGPAGNEQREAIAARRARVERLWLAGFSLRRIAAEAEVDLHTVHDDVTAIRQAIREEAAGADLDAEREKELARLEQQRSQLSPAAARGSVAAHNALLRVADRKAKLLGLDAPQRVAVSGDLAVTLAEGLSDEALAALLTDD